MWVTMPGTPLSRIDPRKNTVTEQFTGVGGDCIGTGFQSIWLSNHQRDDNAAVNLARWEELTSAVGPVGAAVKRRARP